MADNRSANPIHMINPAKLSRNGDLLTRLLTQRRRGAPCGAVASLIQLRNDVRNPQPRMQMLDAC
jgi:hypothetical protein